MPSIADTVTILGMGYSRFGEHENKSAEDMRVVSLGR
jgi:hypothetical protein